MPYILNGTILNEFAVKGGYLSLPKTFNEFDLALTNYLRTIWLSKRGDITLMGRTSVMTEWIVIQSVTIQEEPENEE